MIKCIFENGNEANLRHVVVDSLVVKNNKILLVKRAGKLLEGGKWALVGGYVDRDETIEEAARREVMEETGYTVEELTLLRIIDNPKRPAEDRQNIAFVFFCQAIKKTGNPDWESDEQKWFDLNKIPRAEELAFDHYEDISLYLDFLQNKFDLPVV